MKRIDVDRAARLQTLGAVMVDVLPHTIYVQEHLPGAISLPLTDLSRTSVAAMDRAKPLVVYCFDQH